jgi:hypothetical protein
MSTLNFSDFSRKLLSRPYWSINDLLSELNLSRDELETLMDEAQSKLYDLGLLVELIELHSQEFIVILLEIDEKILNEIQLGILAIFALKTKIEGEILSNANIENILDCYFDQIEFLVSNNYIIHLENNRWELSPLGALTVLPHLDEISQIINTLILQKEI